MLGKIRTPAPDIFVRSVQHLYTVPDTSAVSVRNGYPPVPDTSLSPVRSLHPTRDLCGFYKESRTGGAGTIPYARPVSDTFVRPVTVYRLPIRLPAKSAQTWPVV